MENPIKMNDLGVPLFLETPIYSNSGLSVNSNRGLPPIGFFWEILQICHRFASSLIPKMVTLPKKPPEHRPKLSQKERIIWTKHPFSGVKMLVSGRVSEKNFGFNFPNWT